MNRQETTKLLTTLVSVWSNETIDDAKITAYQWALSDVPYSTAEQAARLHLRRGKFFPKPAELLELIAESATPAMSAGEAWELVQKQINRHGSTGYQSVTFDDPAIADAVRAVGWTRICLDEMKYVRRDFDEALERAQARQRRDVQDGTAAIGGGSVVALPERRAS